MATTMRRRPNPVWRRRRRQPDAWFQPMLLVVISMLSCSSPSSYCFARIEGWNRPVFRRMEEAEAVPPYGDQWEILTHQDDNDDTVNDPSTMVTSVAYDEGRDTVYMLGNIGGYACWLGEWHLPSKELRQQAFVSPSFEEGDGDIIQVCNDIMVSGESLLVLSHASQGDGLYLDPSDAGNETNPLRVEGLVLELQRPGNNPLPTASPANSQAPEEASLPTNDMFTRTLRALVDLFSDPVEATTEDSPVMPDSVEVNDDNATIAPTENNATSMPSSQVSGNTTALPTISPSILGNGTETYAPSPVQNNETTAAPTLVPSTAAPSDALPAATLSPTQTPTPPLIPEEGGDDTAFAIVDGNHLGRRTWFPAGIDHDEEVMFIASLETAISAESRSIALRDLSTIGVGYEEKIGLSVKARLYDTTQTDDAENPLWKNNIWKSSVDPFGTDESIVGLGGVLVHNDAVYLGGSISADQTSEVDGFVTRISKETGNLYGLDPGTEGLPSSNRISSGSGWDDLVTDVCTGRRSWFFYITGSAKNKEGGTGTHAFLMKIRTVDLEPVWTVRFTAKQAEVPEVEGISCVAAADGQTVYFVGNVLNGGVVAEFNTTTASTGGTDIFVANIDSTNGEILSSHQFGSLQNDVVAPGKALIALPNGDAAIVGNTLGDLFESHSSTSVIGYEGFVAIVKADGSVPPTVLTPPPFTLSPTTGPSTSQPTIMNSTTIAPTTFNASTIAPNASQPTTFSPTTNASLSLSPSTLAPTTMNTTTITPSTDQPKTLSPTTMSPTTTVPSTSQPTTLSPTTIAPSTSQPTTLSPTTIAPSTSQPTTLRPTTIAPTLTPSGTPSSSTVPSPQPSEIPSRAPSLSMEPSMSLSPSASPTISPTRQGEEFDFKSLTMRLEGGKSLTQESRNAFEETMESFFNQFFTQSNRRALSTSDIVFVSTIVTAVGDWLDDLGNDVRYDQSVIVLSEEDDMSADDVRDFLLAPFQFVETRGLFLESLRASHPDFQVVSSVSIPELPLQGEPSVVEPDSDEDGGSGLMDNILFIAVGVGAIGFCCCGWFVFYFRRRRGMKKRREQKEATAPVGVPIAPLDDTRPGLERRPSRAKRPGDYSSSYLKDLDDFRGQGITDSAFNQSYGSNDYTASSSSENQFNSSQEKMRVKIPQSRGGSRSRSRSRRRSQDDDSYGAETSGRDESESTEHFDDEEMPSPRRSGMIADVDDEDYSESYNSFLDKFHDEVEEGDEEFPNGPDLDEGSLPASVHSNIPPRTQSRLMERNRQRRRSREAESESEESDSSNSQDRDASDHSDSDSDPHIKVQQEPDDMSSFTAEDMADDWVKGM